MFGALRAALFSGVAALFSGPAAATATYIGGTTSTTDQASTYTFSNHAIGPASDDRHVLVSVQSGHSAARTAPSVTIGGIAATQVGFNASSDDTILCGFYIALVPTGTTANIVVTYSGSAVRCRVDVWTITGLQSTTATDTASDDTDSSGVVSDTLDVQAKGCAFGVYSYLSTGTPTAAWAGLTEQFDGNLEASQYGTSAFDNFATAQSGMTVSVTITNPGTLTKPAFLAVAMR